MRASIVLLGDSIFDNASYVPGELCVTEQLRELVPDDVSVSMLAVDGDMVADVAAQIERLPSESTHLFVSVGGNDALSHYGALTRDFANSERLFKTWADIQSNFRAAYGRMLGKVVATGLPTAVCTIYDSVPGLERIAVTALSLFNDVIVSEAARHSAPIIDLRRVCDEVHDYSDLSPIEPSFKGGKKIASALHRTFETHNFSRSATQIYV